MPRPLIITLREGIDPVTGKYKTEDKLLEGRVTDTNGDYSIIP